MDIDDVERYLEEQNAAMAESWDDDVAASNEYIQRDYPPTMIQTNRFPEPKPR